MNLESIGDWWRRLYWYSVLLFINRVYRPSTRLGSHVAYCLSKTRKYKVISIDNGHNSLPEALVRVSKLSKDELATETKPEGLSQEELLDSAEIVSKQADLTNAAQVRAVFEEYGKGGIWGVIHIAVSPPSSFLRVHSTHHTRSQAYKAVGESTEIPLTYYQNNVAATVSLLQIMDEFDCRRFVYSSSATVYGTPPKVPIPETSPLQAHSPYGKTKVMCETIIDDLCHGAHSLSHVSSSVDLMRLVQLLPRRGKRSLSDTSSKVPPDITMSTC